MADNFLVTEDKYGRFVATDTTAGTTQTIWYNYLAQGNSTTATTWDFAPLDEQMEVDEQGYANFRNRMHSDDQFVRRQFLWNRRLDQWHGSTTSTGINTSLHLTSGACTDDQGTFWITSDVARFHNGKMPWTAKHMPYLWNVYCRGQYLKRQLLPERVKRFTKWLQLNPTAEEVQEKQAEKKSIKLLKSWLDEHEFNEIMKRGELEIFAEDAVYIVKKNPHSTVKKTEKDGTIKSFCLIPQHLGYATGDILLAKILMLKTDPKNFEKQANGYNGDF